MATYTPLKTDYFFVKLPPVKWIHFTMDESQFLGKDKYKYNSSSAWIYTWKAILLASGVPHDGSTEPERFLLSKYDDHTLAVLLRTTIVAKDVRNEEIVTCVTGKPILDCVSIWAGVEAIEIVYPSQVSEKEATRFSVRGRSLEVFELDVDDMSVEEDDIEYEDVAETKG